MPLFLSTYFDISPKKYYKHYFRRPNIAIYTKNRLFCDVESGFFEEFADAPLFDELPMALECKLISYDEKARRLVGEVVNVCANERILGEDDKIDLTKFSPITYDPVHHTYCKPGDVVGKAFSDGLKLK